MSAHRDEQPDHDQALDASRALEQILSDFGGYVRSTAHRHGLSASEQDDAVQDVRIRLWMALRSSENIGSAPASYIYRTALSAVLDYLRRRRARREQDLDAGNEDALPPARRADEADARARKSDVEQAVERALQVLPELRRAAVRLHLAGYDRFEIAELLGWTEAKTRNLLYRGLETLRTELRRMGFDPARGE